MDAFKETMEGYAEKFKFKGKQEELPVGKCAACGMETHHTREIAEGKHIPLCDTLKCHAVYDFRRSPPWAMQRVGVPQAYCDSDIGTFGQNKASPPIPLTPNLPGHLFIGLPGRGKTWCAAAWIREALRVGDFFVDNTRWVNASWFTWELRDAIKNGHEYRTLQSLLKPECLVLDDLGSEQQTNYIRGAYYTVIDHRQQAGKFTLITTNHTQAERHEQDATLASRLGAFTVVKFSGPDLRLGSKA